MRESLAYNDRFQDLNDEHAAAEMKKIRKEAARKVHRGVVEQWKMNRDLFKKYGGRIIFQQAGLEPIDAQREWLEAAEKSGDFAIYDAKLRESFWYYFTKQDHSWKNMKETTGHELDKPWWLQPRDK